jgi:hypothetical protein
MMKSDRMNVEIENSDHETKELYHSPKVELIEVKVEKGFAASPVGDGGSSTGDWGSGGGW